MKYALLLAFLVLSFSACEQNLSVDPQAISSDLSAEEYEVLSSAVEPIISGSSMPVFVLWDSTMRGASPADYENTIDEDSIDALMMKYSLLPVKQKFPVLSQQTMLDFVQKNHTRSYIKDPSKIHPHLVRASATTQRYPSLVVSRIGFSPDRQQALAYVEESWAGYFFVLSRQSGFWKIVGRFTVWYG